jgi:caa(3)-type oxidase subunit IV
MSDEHGSNGHGDAYYIKIWGILVVLLVISVVGPMAEIRVLTLITAFGIAGVKAYLVAQKFMHLSEAPKFVTYIMVTCLVFVLLFFAATAVDVMRPTGDNWEKPAWLAEAAAAEETAEHGESGGHGH